MGGVPSTRPDSTASQPPGCPVQHDEARYAAPAHRPGRRVRHAARHALGLTLLMALPGGAQNSPFHGPIASPASQAMADSQSQFSDRDPVDEEKRLRALNAERQRSLVSDTNKLLKLAQELDGEVKGTNPDSLNMEELTKVAEIEKLAHKVKEKMSTSVRGMTDFQPLLLPQRR